MAELVDSVTKWSNLVRWAMPAYTGISDSLADFSEVSPPGTMLRSDSGTRVKRGQRRSDGCREGAFRRCIP